MYPFKEIGKERNVNTTKVVAMFSHIVAKNKKYRLVHFPDLIKDEWKSWHTTFLVNP